MTTAEKFEKIINQKDAEIKRLRAALLPLAEINIDPYWRDEAKIFVDTPDGFYLTAGQVRTACKLLGLTV